MTFSYYIMGYRRLQVSARDVAPLLELCRARGYVYTDFRNLPDGGVSLSFAWREAGRVLEDCTREGITVCTVGKGGIPVLGRMISKRLGLVVGLLLGLCLLVASSQIVWDVRITGNETVSSGDIERSLAACGFGVGTSLRGFRADVTENRVLMLDDRLAWISINRRGTVAYVQVREAAHAPDDEENEKAANVVASRPGCIERVELVRGLVMVGKGDTVDEGDLLVSGLYDSNVYGYRWTHAEARVYARTVREFHITIPLSYEQKVYTASTGRASRDIFLKFFSKQIKFSKSTGNDGVLCDTIESERSMGILSDVGFPLSVRTVWHLPYTMTTMTRTPAEAEELAYFELAREIEAIPGDVELLRKTVTTHLGESELRLDCTVTCIEDIAATRPIDMIQSPHQE